MYCLKFAILNKIEQKNYVFPFIIIYCEDIYYKGFRSENTFTIFKLLCCYANNVIIMFKLNWNYTAKFDTVYKFTSIYKNFL